MEALLIDRTEFITLTYFTILCKHINRVVVAGRGGGGGSGGDQARQCALRNATDSLQPVVDMVIRHG